MAEMTFPSGYGNDTDTLTEVRAKHQARYHPEAWRRIEATMIASGGLLGLAPDQGLCGIGGGARTREEQAASYARDPNTFAPPDRSFHQVWTWKSGKTGAQAVDWVGRAGRHQEAWKWLRDFGGVYGLKTFWNVNGEPWHSQCTEVPNSVSEWLALGKPDPGIWDLPGASAPPPAPPTAVDFGLWPYNKGKPEIGLGSLGDAVRYCQLVCIHKAGQPITADGEFGPKTEAAVKAVQAYLQGPKFATGRVTRPTWDILDALAGYVAPAPPAPPPGADLPPNVSFMSTGLYFVQVGDSPWKAAERCYGNGAQWQGNFTQEQFSKANYHIPVPGVPGRTTKVIAGEGGYAIIKRLWPATNPYKAGTLQRFYDLNGGPHRTLYVGDVVFLDNPDD